MKIPEAFARRLSDLRLIRAEIQSCLRLKPNATECHARKLTSKRFLVWQASGVPQAKKEHSFRSWLPIEDALRILKECEQAIVLVNLMLKSYSRSDS
ncbi:hypothetical protein GZ78_06385 [Endozoicomonas numazuensis]|uniref:Uncharacterized protein n=1 Tax=Endozoicomonas numazuensis TaxID=1137799 RepID=A0A081NM65_9GAMM|nr:hypothetical protein GZ78_06385 [Endozoicomonas numazuensis]